MFFVYLGIVIKYIIYGSTVFFTARLLTAADGLDIISLRFLLSSAVFLLLWLCRVIKLNFRGKNIRAVFLTALFEPVLYFAFETVGIAGTSTLIAGIFLALIPFFVCLFETIILKERTTALQKLLLGLTIAGAIYIIVSEGGDTGNTSAVGLVCMLLAVICGALYTVFSRKSSSDFSAMEITAFSSFLGAAVFNGINVVRHMVQGTIATYFAPYMQPENLLCFAFLGIAATILGTVLSNFALGKIEASKAAAFCGLSTVVTIVQGVVFNGENLYFYHILGTAMILTGAVGVNILSAKKSEHMAL